jgi:O-antigen/teichoic acid export membrane protein
VCGSEAGDDEDSAPKAADTVNLARSADRTRDQPAPAGIAAAITRHVRTADTSWVVAGSLVGGLGAYLFQVVGTRGLGEAAFAPIGVLWTIQYLVLSIPMLSLEAWVTRETGLGHQVGRGLRVAVLAMLSLAAVVATLGVVFADALFSGLTDLGLIAGLLVLAFGGFVIARGHYAGSERFRAYGIATGGESVLRLLLLVGVLALVGTARSVAWVLPAGPAVATAWWLLGRSRRRGRAPADRPGHTVSEEVLTSPEARSGGFLAATTVANAAAQVLLAGGPLFLVALGAGAAEVSIFFVTITAARTPLVFAIGGVLSRLLPPLTRVVRRGDAHALRRLGTLTVAATLVGALVAAGAAAVVGPEVVALFFGQGFRPERYFVTATAAAAVLATGNLALNQVLIALQAERHLPIPWISGLATAVALATFLAGSATNRVITGLLTGEVVALLGLTATVLWRAKPHMLAALSREGKSS